MRLIIALCALVCTSITMAMHKNPFEDMSPEQRVNTLNKANNAIYTQNQNALSQLKSNLSDFDVPHARLSALGRVKDILKLASVCILVGFVIHRIWPNDTKEREQDASHMHHMR